MKDALLIFVIALVLGSIWNGYQSENQAQGADAGGAGDASQGPGIPLSSVNDTNFKSEVLDQEQPVLVDFYTQSCPHCRNMAPILGQLAQQYSRTLKVVKVDVMENPLVAHKYEVNGVPAFILFDKGAPVESFVGEMSKGRLLSRIKPHLNSSERSSDGSAGTS
jgi:thioredoxin 1